MVSHMTPQMDRHYLGSRMAPTRDDVYRGPRMPRHRRAIATAEARAALAMLGLPDAGGSDKSDQKPMDLVTRCLFFSLLEDF